MRTGFETERLLFITPIRICKLQGVFSVSALVHSQPYCQELSMLICFTCTECPPDGPRCDRCHTEVQSQDDNAIVLLSTGETMSLEEALSIWQENWRRNS